MASTRTQKRGGDVTGREAERLAADHAAELAARERELSMVRAAAAEVDDTPVHVTPNTGAELVEEAPQFIQENWDDESGGVVDLLAQEDIVEAPVEVEDPNKQVKFRVNEDLEQVTIGAGNHYDFYVGKTYIGPKMIFDHLEEKGYIWH